ncbi:hypothetical protein LZK73_26955 (plasmid) [Neorhizobium galegae]|nr:hypothetical protein LZK73_26955 [Neorhizobium galegae]
MKSVLRSAFAALVVTAIALPAWAGDPIRKITVLSRPQAGQQAEFQSVQLIAQEWRKLGLDVEVRAIPWEQMSDEVWYKRDQWDSTAWQMVGRPERSDPDEPHLQPFPFLDRQGWLQFRGLPEQGLRRDR